MATDREVGPVFSESDDITERFQAEVEAAKEIVVSSKPLKKPPGDPFALITDRDDLAEIRRRDLESALVEPEPSENCPSTPSTPADEMDVSSESAVAQTAGSTDGPLDKPVAGETANNGHAAPNASDSDGHQPDADLSYLNQPRTQSSRDTVRKLRTLSSIEKELKENSAVPEAVAVSPLAPRQITMPQLIAASLFLLALPVVTLIYIEMTMSERHQHEDSESVLMQLHRPLESAVNSALNTPLPIKLPDFHSPFRPPTLEVAINPPETSSSDDASTSDADTEGAEKALKWQAPQHPSAPLSADEVHYIEQESHRGELLALNGHVDQAAEIYNSVLTKYPHYTKVRVAAISAYMKLKNYSYAKKLALDGMRTAETYYDYIIFVNLFHNVAELAPSSKH